MNYRKLMPFYFLCVCLFIHSVLVGVANKVLHLVERAPPPAGNSLHVLSCAALTGVHVGFLLFFPLLLWRSSLACGPVH